MGYKYNLGQLLGTVATDQAFEQGANAATAAANDNLNYLDVATGQAEYDIDHPLTKLLELGTGNYELDRPRYISPPKHKLGKAIRGIRSFGRKTLPGLVIDATLMQPAYWTLNSVGDMVDRHFTNRDAEIKEIIGQAKALNEAYENGDDVDINDVYELNTRYKRLTRPANLQGFVDDMTDNFILDTFPLREGGKLLSDNVAKFLDWTGITNNLYKGGTDGK